MKKIKGMLVIVITVFIMITLNGCGEKTTTVKLNKYIKINSHGFDTMGTVVYEFDYDAFIKDYSGKIKVTKNNKELSDKNLTDEAVVEVFLNTCINHKFDKIYELSNGDIVNFEWVCADDIAKKNFGVRLEYKDIKYTVTDLEEISLFDPFEHVDVSFSGISPDGTIKITSDKNSEEMQYIYLVADKYDNIENGDKIILNASLEIDENEFVEKFGCKIEKTEKEYMCDSLAHYVEEVDEISEDIMNKMISQGEDDFRAYVASKWEKPENLISVSLEGNYFLTAKNVVYGEPNNMLYLVYKIQAKNPDPEQIVDFYYYVRFNDIVMLDDGECSVDLSNYIAPVSGWFSSESFNVGSYTYCGYEKLDSLFNNCVVSKVRDYEYTTNINN